MNLSPSDRCEDSIETGVCRLSSVPEPMIAERYRGKFGSWIGSRRPWLLLNRQFRIGSGIMSTRTNTVARQHVLLALAQSMLSPLFSNAFDWVERKYSVRPRICSRAFGGKNSFSFEKAYCLSTHGFCTKEKSETLGLPCLQSIWHNLPRAHSNKRTDQRNKQIDRCNSDRTARL